MKKFPLLLFCLAVSATAPAHAAMVLESTDIRDNAPLQRAQIYNGHVCTGDNLSPVLMWREAPPQTKSFAVTVYDPDARPNVGMWHWVVYNIPASVSGLAGGIGKVTTLPAGAAEAKNSFDNVGYDGACPPRASDIHRYIFTVYALKVSTLESPPGSPASAVKGEIDRHTVGEAMITATYQRP